MGIVPNNDQTFISTMSRKILFWPLAAMLLTACEKGLDVGEDVMSPDVGQVKNSLLQVRTLSGTITGAAWKGERTISFDFDESGSSSGSTDEGNGDEGGCGESDLPAVGTLYQGCYVLANNGTTATLLSPNETSIGKSYTTYTYDEEGLNEAISNLIANTAVDGISGWRLPTLAELNAIYSASETANDLFEADGGTVLTNARRYFYTDADGNLKSRGNTIAPALLNHNYPIQ